MVGYDDNENALTLGDDDSLKVGDYELKYSSTDDEWQAEYGRPIGGELGNHGEINGAEYSILSQVGDNSLEFGGDDFVNTNTKLDIDQNTAFSCTFWVNLDNVPTGFNVFVADEDGDNPSGWAIRNGGVEREVLRFQWRNRGGSAIKVNTDNNVLTDSWIHVGVTFDGTDANGVTLYINGSEVPSTVEENSSVDDSSRSIHIGERSTGGGGIDGLMDDVRIYKKVLSSSEVSDIFNGTNVTDSLELLYDFEFPETPNVAIDSTGEAFPKNAIPRSTSGSLVPEGFADVLSNGEVLADNGEIYASVQDAVNAASGFVFVGPGTFNENVTISTDGLTLQGSGHDTLIDGGTTNDAISANQPNITISNLSVQSTGGGGNAVDAIRLQNSATSCTVNSVVVRDSDRHGIHTTAGADHRIVNCTINGADSAGVRVGTEPRCVVSGCTVDGTGVRGISLFGDSNADDGIIANCVVRNTGGDGIGAFTRDAVVIGNRVISAGNDGIKVTSTDVIVANNRVSGSTASNIFDNGTGTVLDGNLTGPSN